MPGVPALAAGARRDRAARGRDERPRRRADAGCWRRARPGSSAGSPTPGTSGTGRRWSFASEGLGPAVGRRGRRRYPGLARAHPVHASVDRGAAAAVQGPPPGARARSSSRRSRGRRSPSPPASRCRPGLASAAVLSARAAEGAGQLRAHRGIQGVRHVRCARGRSDASDDRGARLRRRLPRRRARRSTSPRVRVRRATVEGTPSCCSATRTRCSSSRRCEKVAARRSWRLVQLTKAGCPPAAVRVVSPLTRRATTRECEGWRAHALRSHRARERPADRRRAPGRRTPGASPGGPGSKVAPRARARSAAGYPPVLRAAACSGRRAVMVIRSRRGRRSTSRRCVSGSLRKLRRCAFARGAAPRAPRPSSAPPGASPECWFSIPRTSSASPTCPSVIGGVLVYRNSGHVTASFAATLAPVARPAASAPRGVGSCPTEAGLGEVGPAPTTARRGR